MRSMHGQHGRLVGRLAVAGLALAGLFALPGCYSNWPPVEGYGQTELNNPSTRGVLAAAGRWALQRYKPATPVAFNMPAGLRRSGVLEVIASIGGGAQALTEETASTCTIYHLARINLTNDTAEMDVIVPVGAGGGEYQMTQLRLTGRGAAWRVVVAREWETLVRPVPALAYLPASDYPAASDEDAKPKPWKDSASAEGEDAAER